MGHSQKAPVLGTQAFFVCVGVSFDELWSTYGAPGSWIGLVLVLGRWCCSKFLPLVPDNVEPWIVIRSEGAPGKEFSQKGRTPPHVLFVGALN